MFSSTFRCISTLFARVDDARCCTLSHIRASIDKTLVVVANRVLNAGRRSLLASPLIPSKTILWDIPGTPTFPTSVHKAPQAFYILFLFVGIMGIAVLVAALVKMGVFPGVNKYRCHRVKGISRLLNAQRVRMIVAFPLFTAGANSRLFHHPAIVSDMGRLLSQAFNAITRTADRVSNIFRPSGRKSIVDVAHDRPTVQALPGFEAILHPDLSWYDLSEMIRTALPEPNVFTDTRATLKVQTGFWGAERWKSVSSLGIGDLCAGDFQLVHNLGSGASGDVVKVKQGTRGQTLAIKRLKKRGPPEPKADSSVSPCSKRVDARTIVPFSRNSWEALISEVEVHLMMADHPGFPRVHGVWHDHDFYFIATDCGSECFVNLDVLSSFDQPRHMALLFAAQLILGLHALHKRGVAHLDVKPDNLLLSETNELLIIDYGVAGRFDVLDTFDPPSREDYPTWYTAKDAGSDTFPFLWSGPDNPHSVEVLQSGTPRYQSPPVKSGDPVSYGTDLWAVGMIMHQWLTGHLPVFEADDWEVDAKLEQFDVDVDFFQRIFSCVKATRFESYEELKAHAIWKTAPWKWEDVEDLWFKRV